MKTKQPNTESAIQGRKLRPPAAGEYLGGVGINQINALHGIGNLGYWVRSSRVGEGIASAAALLVARFGLVAGGLVRIEIVVHRLQAPGVLGMPGAGIMRQEAAVTQDECIHAGILSPRGFPPV